MGFEPLQGKALFKGYVSNTKYIWHASPGSCEACQDLDGTEYNSLDEIPDKSNPNCNCYVEEINDEEESSGNYETIPTDDDSEVPIVVPDPIPTVPHSQPTNRIVINSNKRGGFTKANPPLLIN